MKLTKLLVLAIFLLSLTVSSVKAFDLGSGVSVGTSVMFAKPFDVTVQQTGDVTTTSYSSRKDQYLMDFTGSVNYGIFRLFGTYDNLTHDQATKTFGVDAAIYSTSQYNVVSRTARIFEQCTGFTNRTIAYEGLVFTLK